jgi:hypothetical protein
MFPYSLDLSWVIAFQSLGDWLIFPMRFFSFLGTEEFYILIMPILYWCLGVGRHATILYEIEIILTLAVGGKMI